MALSGSLFSSIGGAVDSIFGAIGDQKAASGFKKAAVFQDRAAAFAMTEAELVGRSTAIQRTQLDRELYMAIGRQNSDVATAGFTDGGSAFYLMRSSAQQAALSRQLLETQGAITQSGYHAAAEGYRAEAESYRSQASAKNTSATGGFLSAGLSIIGAVLPFFSDRRLKQDIEFVREERGFKLYRFRYEDDPQVYEGVMVQDLIETHPGALVMDESGYVAVNYHALGLELKKVA